MPRFAPCAICGRATGEAPRFDPEHGGVTCEACAPRVHGVPVPGRVVDALRALQAGQRTPLPADVRGKARELLNLFIAHHLGRRLNSVDFMTQVGLD